MKKHVLSFALVATMIASIATGCSSEKKTGSSDSTAVDSTKMSTPTADTAKKSDTTKMDTSKKDTTKKM